MHINNGCCLACGALFNRYPNFYSPLRGWFMTFQRNHPEAHISCAGRGRLDQEAFFARGASKARYGESAHNFNAAIDLFRLLEGEYDLAKDWFSAALVPALTPDLNWYGRPGAPFYERPHIEIGAWNQMAKNGILKLVE